LATALGPDYLSLMLFRFIAGLPHGAYFGVAALTAVAITPPEARGRAVSLSMLGLTLAILLGTPLATWMGQLASWRWTNASVARVSLPPLCLLALYVTAYGKAASTRVLEELRALIRLPVWKCLAIGAICFARMFSVFGYLGPTMVQVIGVAPAW